MLLAASETFVRVGWAIVAVGAIVLWRAKKFDLTDAFLHVLAVGGIVAVLLAADDWLGLAVLAAWSAYVAWEAKPVPPEARGDEEARESDLR